MLLEIYAVPARTAAGGMVILKGSRLEHNASRKVSCPFDYVF
jgi:hypothetical protein